MARGHGVYWVSGGRPENRCQGVCAGPRVDDLRTRAKVCTASRTGNWGQYGRSRQESRDRAGVLPEVDCRDEPSLSGGSIGGAFPGAGQTGQTVVVRSLRPPAVTGRRLYWWLERRARFPCSLGGGLRGRPNAGAVSSQRSGKRVVDAADR